jgi:hypothetical protein
MFAGQPADVPTTDFNLGDPFHHRLGPRERLRLDSGEDNLLQHPRTEGLTLDF